jgi:hypothetical protein
MQVVRQILPLYQVHAVLTWAVFTGLASRVAQKLIGLDLESSQDLGNPANTRSRGRQDGKVSRDMAEQVAKALPPLLGVSRVEDKLAVRVQLDELRDEEDARDVDQTGKALGRLLDELQGALSVAIDEFSIAGQSP